MSTNQSSSVTATCQPAGEAESIPASFVSKSVYTFTVYHRSDSPFTLGEDEELPGGPLSSELGLAMQESYDGHAIGHEMRVSTTLVPLDQIPEFFVGDDPGVDCARCGADEVTFIPLGEHLPYECGDCGHIFSPDNLNLGHEEDEQMPDDTHEEEGGA